MSSIIFVKLATIFAVIAIGWGAAQTRALRGQAAAQTMSNTAFYLLIPAMLFRTTARIDLDSLPWGTLAAYFGPAVTLLFVVYWWRRVRHAPNGTPNSTPNGAANDTRDSAPADPAVLAISTTFGNAVQLGLPVVTAFFGDAGLSVHIAIISMHALSLMTVATVLAELDVARATAKAKTDGDRPQVIATALVTARRTIVHPIVLPVLLGLGWNLLGPALPGVVDDVLVLLSQGVAPVCLLTIGMSLAHYGVAGVLRQALVVAAGKLLIQPALVLGVAHWGVGLHGTTLATVVIFAGLPVASNALIFAQRYHTREADVTAAILISTVGFAVTAPLWLFIVSAIAL